MRATASNSDHGSIQGNVIVDIIPRGDDVYVLHLYLACVFGALIPYALGFGGVPRRLRLCCLFNLERVLVCNRVLLVQVLEPTRGDPTGHVKKSVAFWLHFYTDRASHAMILC